MSCGYEFCEYDPPDDAEVEAARKADAEYCDLTDGGSRTMNIFKPSSRKKIRARDMIKNLEHDNQDISIERDVTKIVREYGMLKLTNLLYGTRYNCSIYPSKNDVRYKKFVTRTWDLLINKPRIFLSEYTSNKLNKSMFQVVWSHIFDIDWPVNYKDMSIPELSRYVRTYYHNVEYVLNEQEQLQKERRSLAQLNKATARAKSTKTKVYTLQEMEELDAHGEL
jgi:hypothetical protein